MRHPSLFVSAVALGVFLALVVEGRAEPYHRAGTEFNAVRLVTIPAAKMYTVVVTEFMHHGEIQPDGKNVVVCVQNREKELVPMRILQLGPGDFCRLAFQTKSGHSEYEIFYGGEPPKEPLPEWSCKDGLLLETRHFVPCNFNDLNAVRNAFDKAKPMGGDYVEGVFQSYDPFSLKDEAFLSHYGGHLDIRKSGTYGFITTSQDCSFLLVDDKLVTAAPGYHGPMYQARPGCRHDVKLAAGLHKFDYYHAAASSNAIMVAAWEIDPLNPDPQSPAIIPPDAFHAQFVGHLPANHLALRKTKSTPDFVVKIVNDVPLPDNNVPLIGVLFRDVSSKSLSMQGAKWEWDFGDGQTSDLPNVDHVYLRPGLYTVTLSSRHSSKTVAMTNRIYVDRPHLGPKEKLYTFDDYMKIIETYDPAKLDAGSLLQLVAALEAKSLMVTNQVEVLAKKMVGDPNRRPTETKKSKKNAQKPTHTGMPPEAEQYLEKAVALGKTPFVGESVARGDKDLLKLAEYIGPMAREQLGDSESAYQIWRGAAERIKTVEMRSQCAVEAADITINDLLKPAEAKPMLKAAAKWLGKDPVGATAGALQRVWGDYYAATGDGAAARKAYAEAAQVGSFARPLVETTATRGAHARSTEDFLKEKKFAQAMAELQSWQRESPTEKIDGYWTLLYARYWASCGKFAQAIAQAEQLQAVNSDSPYADQLLWVAADSEMHLGHKDRAIATLQSLLKSYPGSPLVPMAKQNITVLEKGE